MFPWNPELQEPNFTHPVKLFKNFKSCDANNDYGKLDTEKYHRLV